MSILRNAVFSTVLLILAGCSIIPAPNPMDVNYYDLGSPSEKISFGNSKVSVGNICSCFPSERKMMFRDGGNRIYFDECNRWVAPPEAMIRLYIVNKLSSSNSGWAAENVKGNVLSAEILRIEGDINKSAADFSVRYEMSDNIGNKIFSQTYSESVKMDQVTASAFASAISKGLDSTLLKFNQDFNAKK